MVRKLSMLSIVLGVVIVALAVGLVATLKHDSVLSAQLVQYRSGSAPAVSGALAVTTGMSSRATRTASLATRSSLAAVKRPTTPTRRLPTTRADSPLPFNSAGLMMGTAKPKFEAGTAGTIDVVAAAAIPKDDGTGTADIPIALRNNTSATVSSIQIAATFRNKAGSIVATASTTGTQPGQLVPGEVGLADLLVDTGGKQIPTDATISYTAQSSAPGTSPLNVATAKVTEANRVGSNIVGSARNTSTQTIGGPLEAEVWCFDKSGHLTAKVSGLTEGQSSIAPQASASFTVDLGLLQLAPSAPPACDSYSVGVTGYYS